MNILISVLVLLGWSAQAQQAVFNVPSADFLDVGKSYSELDLLYFPERGSRSLEEYFLTVRAVYGVASNLEAGVNVGSIHEGGPSPSVLFPVKWKALGLEESLSFICGGEVGMTLDPSYLLGRGYFKLDWTGLSQRIRAGIGHYLASKNYFQEYSTSGVLATFEVKLGSMVSLAADWISGNHSSGLLSAGAIVSLRGGSDLLYFAGVHRNGESDYGGLFEYGHYW